jgi:hypothetical protein
VGRALVLGAIPSTEVATVDTSWVGGTVLLGEPSGGRVSGVVEPSSTLQPAASIATPIATHAKRFMTSHGRSLMTG